MESKQRLSQREKAQEIIRSISPLKLSLVTPNFQCEKNTSILLNKKELNNDSGDDDEDSISSVEN